MLRFETFKMQQNSSIGLNKRNSSGAATMVDAFPGRSKNYPAPKTLRNHGLYRRQLEENRYQSHFNEY